MASPDFVPQDDTNFTDLRYFTALDPYFYTVDNRPLQDIETNLKADRSGGSDAARRAAVFNAVNLSGVLADLYSAPLFSGVSRVITGLSVSVPVTNSITISTGSMYELLALSTTVTDVLMKQAIMTKPVTFALTAPVTGGTSIVYTVEALRTDITTSSLATTTLPVMDADNPFLPSTLIHGELILNVVAGAAATTGTEVPASTTASHVPLYNVTYTQGTALPSVTAHANSPYIKGLNSKVTPVALSSGGATIGVTNETPTVTFADSATSGVMLPMNGVPDIIYSVNPYKPIKLKLTFASSADTGNLALRLRYKGYELTDLITATLVTGSTEAVAVTGAINAIQTTITTTAIIPNTAFAGFSSGVWTITKEKLNIILERLGSDGADTNTGDMILLTTTLLQ